MKKLTFPRRYRRCRREYKERWQKMNRRAIEWEKDHRRIVAGDEEASSKPTICLMTKEIVSPRIALWSFPFYEFRSLKRTLKLCPRLAKLYPWRIFAPNSRVKKKRGRRGTVCVNRKFCNWALQVLKYVNLTYVISEISDELFECNVT